LAQAHVLFVHGIGQKPDKSALLGIWRRALTSGQNGFDLGAEGVGSSMCYWADVLYPAPDPNVAAHESADELEAVKAEVTDTGEALALNQAVDPDWLARLNFRLTQEAPELEDEEWQSSSAAPTPDERFPLPWPVKERFLKVFLRDVHHYLLNVDYEPRPGERYRVRDEIRRRFLSELEAVPKDRTPVIVISHSMGTVIAYDCLANLPECRKIDALVTLGSPLGIDEVQDKLAPGWSRQNGFPRAKVRGDWVNGFDRFDVVAALDPKLANDFQENGQLVINDIGVTNEGSWRHTLRKYFQRQVLRAELRRLLDRTV
jgi:hypothetical protein